MPKQLTNLVLEELSLVDEGANEESRVLIAKRKPEEMDPKTGKPKKPGSMLGTSSSPGVINGDPATSTPNAGADAGAAVAKARLAMLQHLPDFADQLIAKALAASPAADQNAAALAAASITEIFMDLAQLSAALEKAEADNAVHKARADAAEALVKSHETTIAKMKGDLEEVQKGRGLTDEQQDEQFLKGLPEGVRNRIVADRAATKLALESVEKMRSEKEEGEAIAKARTLGVAEPERAGPLLVRVAKGMTTEGGLYRAHGTNAGAHVDGTDPEAALNAAATEIAKSKGLSHAKAYELAMKENPGLYQAYIAKRR
jgi:hypothetical protein